MTGARRGGMRFGWRGPLAILAMAIAVAAILAPPAGAASRAVVEPLNGTVRTAERPAAQHLAVLRIDGVDYVELRVVARLFHATKYWRAELEKMVLKVAGHRVRLTVGSPYVFVDDRGVNLFAPVRWEGGRIFVPIRLATDVLDELTGDVAKWDEVRHALTVGTGEPNVLGLAYDVRQNGTLVQLTLSERLDGRLEYPRPDRVVLVIPHGVLEEGMMNGFPGKGLLDSVETMQQPGASVITFHLGLLGGTAELIPRSSPPRLVVAVSESVPDDIPLPGFERPDESAEPMRDVSVVVIDPGHGGSDTGIVAEGMAEKDITLAIARELQRSLGDLDPDLSVILTRDDDRFLTNEARAQIANAAEADVFVSLHANGWFHGGVRGYSVGMYGGPTAHPPSEFARWGEPDPDVAKETERLAETVLDAMG
ncbi:N-acetylmuramoyl-L-alanine amidase, partial [bacterium]|nr:N-acetylmuramoyl-L-alanine amidase [bacterium]